MSNIVVQPVFTVPSDLVVDSLGARTQGDAYTLFAPALASDPLTITASDGRYFTWKPTELVYKDSAGALDYIVGSSPQSLVATGKQARYNRTFPFASDVFRAEAGRVKHWAVLDEAPRLPATYLGAGIEFGVSGIVNGTPLPVGIHDSISAGPFNLPQPVIRDLAGNEIKGNYEVVNTTGGQQLFIWFDYLYLQTAVYPVMIDPTVIVASSYIIHGNGGRKIARAGNGWLVALLFDSVNYTHIIYKSTDNGATWTVVCSINYTNYYQYAGSLACYGNNIYILVPWSTTSMYFFKFDITTQTNVNIDSTKLEIDPGQLSVQVYASLAVDSLGYLHAAWCSRNATYNNSTNIRSAKSVDGGVTWTKQDGTAGVDQVSTLNTVNYSLFNPCIICDKNNIPFISAEYNGNNSTLAIVSARFITNAWSYGYYIYNGGIYQQTQASLITQKKGINAGRIWCAWHGTDGTDNSYFNIKVVYSDDNGSTWSAMLKITSGNTVDRINPVLTEDHLGNIFVFYADNGTVVYQKCLSGTATFGSLTTVATGTNPASMDYETNYIAGIMYSTATNVSLSVLTLETAPTAPVVTSPNGGETWNASQTVTWTPSIDAEEAQASLQYEITLSIDSGATYPYTIASLTAAGATSLVYDFSSIPQSSTCIMRIRAYDGVLYGPYDTSNGVFSIIHNLPPTQPTNLYPASGSYDRAVVIRLGWQFNDPNAGDTQSKFDLMYSPDAVTWTTVTQSTNLNYWDAPANTFTHGILYWKVRTYDQLNVVGVYSNQVSFTAGDKPATPIITAPTASVAVSRPVVQWSSVGQVDYQVQVLNTFSAVIWDSTDVISTNKAVTVGVDLANSTNYTIKVRIKNSDGVWSDWATLGITVSYTPPATPTLTVISGVGHIDITITNPVPSGSQPTVTGNDVYRRESGTTLWTRITANVPQNSIYSDYAVASAQTYEYKVTAIGSNGTVTDSTVAQGSVTFSGAWLHDITNPVGTVRQYKYDGEARSAGWSAESTLMKFAGRKLPVVAFGEFEDNQIQASLKMQATSGDMEALRALVQGKGTICYRDGRGRKIFGTIQTLPEQDEFFGYSVIITVNAIDYSEVV